MICPECGGEYREGITQCSDCEVPLIKDPGPPEEPVHLNDRHLVTVLEIVDPAVLPVAKSLLEDAGIPYLMKGEGIQDLWGVGQIGGFNPISGPIELQVAEDQREEVLELLSDLDDCLIPDSES